LKTCKECMESKSLDTCTGCNKSRQEYDREMRKEIKNSLKEGKRFYLVCSSCDMSYDISARPLFMEFGVSNEPFPCPYCGVPLELVDKS
jgi:transcription initiation factor IIE alpha subunit